MTCPKCGASIEIGQPVCSNCNSKLKWKVPQSTANSGTPSNVAKTSQTGTRIVENKHIKTYPLWISKYGGILSTLSLIIPPLAWIMWIVYHKTESAAIKKSLKRQVIYSFGLLAPVILAVIITIAYALATRR